MDRTAQQTNIIIHIGDLQPGIALIDTYERKEKIISRVETHATFVQLFLRTMNPDLLY